MTKINIESLENTCLACPSQWDGLSDHGWVHIHFRHGCLTVTVASETILTMRLPGDGVLSNEEMQRYLGGIFEFPAHIGSYETP